MANGFRSGFGVGVGEGGSLGDGDAIADGGAGSVVDRRSDGSLVRSVVALGLNETGMLAPASLVESAVAPLPNTDRTRSTVNVSAPAASASTSTTPMTARSGRVFERSW